MRELTLEEIEFVTGGHCEDSGGGEQTGTDRPNEYLGGATAGEVRDVLIEVYEGVVAATSHVIERVADAFKD